MHSSYRALCSDFYINAKMNVRMELPTNREPVLDLFERARRSFPAMNAFRRYKDELALESAANATPHRWMAIRAASVRTGVVNPSNEEDMYSVHRLAAEVSPYYLSISPLDLEYIELLYGFDLAAKENHDEIAASALLSGSPMAALLENEDVKISDCQPMLGMNLLNEDGLEAHFEIKTRTNAKGTPAGSEPISVYLTLRKYDPVTDLTDLTGQLDELIERGQRLVDQYAVPNLLVPLRDEIVTRSY
ncbi:MAG: hypothetical protein JJ974_04300 [Phycisphaerales bacterium]|nr:hypothetical protein [Phycisphaerales bacterium]